MQNNLLLNLSVRSKWNKFLHPPRNFSFRHDSQKKKNVRLPSIAGNIWQFLSRDTHTFNDFSFFHDSRSSLAPILQASLVETSWKSRVCCPSQRRLTSPVIHSDAFLASPAFLFRAVFRFEAAETGTRASFARSHGRARKAPRRYLRGDRGVRADTYGRPHFSLPSAIPPSVSAADFWIFDRNWRQIGGGSIL